MCELRFEMAEPTIGRQHSWLAQANECGNSLFSCISEDRESLEGMPSAVTLILLQLWLSRQSSINKLRMRPSLALSCETE